MLICEQKILNLVVVKADRQTAKFSGYNMVCRVNVPVMGH